MGPKRCAVEGCLGLGFLCWELLGIGFTCHRLWALLWERFGMSLGFGSVYSHPGVDRI